MTNGTMVKPNASLETYGNTEVIAEIARRLKIMMAGGARYTDEEALSLAQASYAYDLNPINGELWLIKDEKTGKVYGLMIGVKGHRKWARNEMKSISGNFWTLFYRIDDVEERRHVGPGMTTDAMMFECRLFDTETIRLFAQSWAELSHAGIPQDAIKSMLGDRPYTTGYGMAWPGEMSKMTIIQRAMKRAEADALKRRFGAPANVKIAAVEDSSEYTPENPNDVIDMWVNQSGSAEMQEAVERERDMNPERDTAPETEAQHAINESKLGREGFQPGSQPVESAPAPAPIPAPEPAKDTTAIPSQQAAAAPIVTPSIKKFIADKAAMHQRAGHEANDKQRKLFFLVLQEACGDDSAKRHTIQTRIFGFAKFDDITSEYVLAGFDWLKPYMNGDKKYHANALALQEVEVIIKEALVDAGQQPLI